MTRREAAVITAFTGILIGSFSDFHEYAESIMGRPIWSHEFGNKAFSAAIKEKSRSDFLAISENIDG